MARHRRRLWALALLLFAAVALGLAANLEQRIRKAFADGDYRSAAGLIEEFLERTPNDPVMLYNAACAYARLGEGDRAADYLLRSVQAGLRDVAQIKRDPDLASIRDHATYKTLVARVEWSSGREAQAALDRWRELYGENEYRYERDDERHLAYATALDSESHQQMRLMLEREADHRLKTLLGAVPSQYVLIAVPTPRDARRLFDNDQIGGIYEHSRRQLIARDIGASLRHEFFHAMHYAHMDQVGQLHPLWVQEGLASLYEDYRLLPDGSAIFLANERHNVVKGLADDGALLPWAQLFALSEERFMALATTLYPQVRSIFEFVADQGKLRAWYNALVAGFQADPTGAKAFVVAFGMPLADVERAWRRWVARRPPIDTSIDPGDAALGVETDPAGSNDGVLVKRVLSGSAAAIGQLRPGDVIVSVDGQATRSLPELQAVIARKSVGETVRVRARRDGDYLSLIIRLRPLRSMNG